MRIVWVGNHSEGVESLLTLISLKADIVAIITLERHRSLRYSSSYDYSYLASKYNIPCHLISSINSTDAVQLLNSLNIDLLFVIGWSQILSSNALNQASIGVVGSHASLLPSYRGSAPINWALLNGLEYTGNTLLWLDSSVDSGDIISQVRIDISPYDDCCSLYSKVARANSFLIKSFFLDAQRGVFPRLMQKYN